VHGLRGNEGSASQLGVGVAVTTADETERGVFGDGELERSEDGPKAAANAAIQNSHRVAEARRFDMLHPRSVHNMLVVDDSIVHAAK
jgi:hypothetical protein